MASPLGWGMSKEAPCPGMGSVPLYLQLECIVYLLLVDGLLSGTPQAPSMTSINSVIFLQGPPLSTLGREVPCTGLGSHYSWIKVGTAGEVPTHYSCVKGSGSNCATSRSPNLALRENAIPLSRSSHPHQTDTTRAKHSISSISYKTSSQPHDLAPPMPTSPSHLITVCL